MLKLPFLFIPFLTFLCCAGGFRNVFFFRDLVLSVRLFWLSLVVSHFEHLHSQYLKLSFLVQSLGAFFLCQSHPLAWVRCTPSSPSPHLGCVWATTWHNLGAMALVNVFSIFLGGLLFSNFHLNSKDVKNLCLCSGAQLAFHSWCPPFRHWLLSISSEVLPVSWRLLSAVCWGPFFFFFYSCLGAQTLKQLCIKNKSLFIDIAYFFLRDH